MGRVIAPNLILTLTNRAIRATLTGMTPAQELRLHMRALPARPSRWAQWLGVTPTTMSRYRAEAIRDDGDNPPVQACPPSPSILHLARLVLVVRKVAPGMLASFSGAHNTHAVFVAALDTLRVEAVTPGELTRAERRSLTACVPVGDGADDE